MRFIPKEAVLPFLPNQQFVLLLRACPFASSSDTLVVESRFLLRSHEITKIERLSLSDDGKTLHYAIEIQPAKPGHEFSFDFDLS